MAGKSMRPAAKPHASTAGVVSPTFPADGYAPIEAWSWPPYHGPEVTGTGSRWCAPTRLAECFGTASVS